MVFALAGDSTITSRMPPSGVRLLLFVAGTVLQSSGVVPRGDDRECGASPAVRVKRNRPRETSSGRIHDLRIGTGRGTRVREEPDYLASVPHPAAHRAVRRAGPGGGCR